MSQLPTLNLALAGGAACLCNGILYMNLVSINIPQLVMERFVNESYHHHTGQQLDPDSLNLLWGFVVSIPTLSAILGAFLTSPLCEKLGRKNTAFLVVGITNMISSILCAVSCFTNIWELLLIGRAVLGLALGLGTGALLLYNTECSPPSQRAILGTMYAAGGWFGIFLSLVLTLPQVLGTRPLLQYFYIVQAIFCLLLLTPVFFVHETPKYLFLKRGDKDGARKAIEWFYGKGWNVNQVIQSFAQEGRQSSAGKSVPISALFTIPHLRKGLLVGVAALLARVTCGITLLNSYSANMITTEMRQSEYVANYVTLGQFFPQMFETILTAYCLERFGRRVVFFGSLSTMILCEIVFVVFSELHSGLGQDWMSDVGLAAEFVCSIVFALGVTPVCFIIISEVTPQAARSLATSFAVSIYYVAYFLYTMVFPRMISSQLHTYTFLILCIAPTLALLAYLYKEMPETKGKTIDVIVANWMTRKERQSIISRLSRLSSVYSDDGMKGIEKHTITVRF